MRPNIVNLVAMVLLLLATASLQAEQTQPSQMPPAAAKLIPLGADSNSTVNTSASASIALDGTNSSAEQSHSQQSHSQQSHSQQSHPKQSFSKPTPATETIKVISQKRRTTQGQSTGPRSARITGVIVDHSKSALGQEFAFGFKQIWRNQPTQIRSSITLKEESSALRGNRIVITHNNNIVYTASLNRRNDNEANGRAAATTVIQQLRSLNRNRSFDPDLAPDEF